jgi:multiple sugar transport system permease protein
MTEEITDTKSFRKQTDNTTAPAPQVAQHRRRTTWSIGRIFAHLALLVMMVAVLFPIYWLVITSFKDNSEALGPPATFWPNHFTLHSYEVAFKESLFPGLINSFLAALISTVIAVLIGTLAAYSLERHHFRLRNDVAFWILSQRMMPPIAVAIPFFLVMQQLHLTDTLFALILLYVTFNTPLAVWLMRPFVRDIPVEMEQAALLDGYKPLTVFRKITLPLLKTPMATTAIFVYIFAWNEFLFALILTRVHALTLPIAISSLGGNPYGVEWAQIATLSVVAIVPVLILYIFVQRYMVTALTFGSVKG